MPNSVPTATAPPSRGYVLTPADPQDAPAIAALFAQSWTSPFAQLQFGTHISADALTPGIKKQIRNPQMRFDVMRAQGVGDDCEDQEIVAVAQWTIPYDEDADANVDQGGTVGEDEEARRERDEFEDEAFRRSLPDEYNKDLILEFTTELRDLRRQVIKGRKHYRTSITQLNFPIFSLAYSGTFIMF